MEEILASLSHAALWVVEQFWSGLRAPLDPQSPFFWLYGAIFIGLGAATVIWYGGRRQGIRAILSRIFPREIYLHPSARKDVEIYLLNRLYLPFNEMLHVGTVIGISIFIARTLARIFGRNVHEPLSTGTLILLGITLWAARDFGAWLNHWLYHKVSFLWPFHKLHHSAQVLTPITLYREHPMFYLLSGQIRGVSMGVVQGLTFYFFTGGSDPFLIGVFSLVFTAFNLMGRNLRHSHLWLSYGPYLSYLLISPAQHQLHHSKAPRHHDVNFGVVLALWDWLFGTLYVPREREEIEYGLADEETQPHSTLARSYLLPFRESIDALRRSLPGRSGSDSIDVRR